jgi:hypothetical protein
MLTAAERGVESSAYRLTLSRGSLPGDTRALSLLMGLTEEEVAAALPALSGVIGPESVDPSRLVHATAAAQLREAEQYRTEQSRRGRMAWKRSTGSSPEVSTRQPIVVPEAVEASSQHIDEDAISAAILRASGHAAGPRIVDQLWTAARRVDPSVTSDQLVELIYLTTRQTKRVRSAAFYLTAVPEALRSAAGQRIMATAPSIPEPERCAECDGRGFTGVAAGGTPVHVRDAVRAGRADLCQCQAGEHWRALLEDAA